MAGGVPEFACTSCGKSYKWKPEYAGRKVKCQCGFVMTAPAEEPPVALAEEEDDLYALADDKPAAPPAPPAQVRQAAPVTARSAPAVARAPVMARAPAPVAVTAPRSPVLGYVGAGRLREPEGRPRGDVFTDPLRDYILPGALLLAGTVLAVVDYMYFTMELPFRAALPVVGILLTFELTIMLMGSLLMVRLLDLGFGPVGPGLLKLAAIAIAPGAVCNILGAMMGFGGIFLMMSVSLAMYWALFWYFFDMDFSEMMYLIAIVWLIRTWAQYLIIGFLMGLFASGASGLGGGPGAGAGVGGTGTTIVVPGGGGGGGEDVGLDEE